MSGRVVHFEVPYDDADRAPAFYANVFGWAIESMPEFDYDFVQTGPTDEGSGMPVEPGYIGGGMFQRQTDVGPPVITVDVDEMVQALARIVEHGGAAVGEPQKVRDMGIAAYITQEVARVHRSWAGSCRPRNASSRDLLRTGEPALPSSTPTERTAAPASPSDIGKWRTPDGEVGG